MLYGCETGTLTADQIRRVEAAEMQFFRQVAGHTLLYRIQSEEIKCLASVKQLSSIE